jgi:ABC-type transport system substrate-binding protein
MTVAAPFPARPGCVPVCIGLALLLAGCTNNPYRPGETAEPTYFSSFATPPTKLDPASSYYSHEGDIIDQIYEPPFAYHFLKRPYELVPLIAEEIPQPAYFDNEGRAFADADPPAGEVGRAEYTIRIRKGVMYQDHPCFALDDAGQPLYANVSREAVRAYDSPADFPVQGTRELVAHDYALQVRRLADPRLASPIFSTMERYILGFTELQAAYQEMLAAERLRRKERAGLGYSQEADEKTNPVVLDYFAADFPGLEVVGPHEFKVVLKRKYPQIKYWMCMHFFAPVPQEALDFYGQAAMAEKQFSLNKWPVGTGPYYLKVFRPNEIIVMEKNPNYHEHFYPGEGSPEDEARGLLADAGKRVPFVNRQVYSLEKEAIPRWHKFLQGYYDASAISVDVFDNAVDLQAGDGARVSPAMEAQGIELVTDVDTAFWYMTFNMLDDIVGGPPEFSDPEREADREAWLERNRKLRQAISISLDCNEFLDIFVNGRGLPAQGPLPPGIFGYRGGEEGTNPYTDVWNPERRRHERKPIAEARRLMAEAGYPDGRDPDGQPLTLYYDHSQAGDPTFRSMFEWTRGRMALLGIKLKERPTDLSRMREKRNKGNWQISSSGWLADYPDPENFLFLFYGPNGKVKTEGGGSNSVNYESEEFDELFRSLESMENGDARQALIDRAMEVIQRDAPAVWQYFPETYILHHAWYRNVKVHQMMKNTMQYKRLDTALRVKRQREWNKPVWWPLACLAGLIVLGSIPAGVAVYRRERGL